MMISTLKQMSVFFFVFFLFGKIKNLQFQEELLDFLKHEGSL